MAMIDPSSSLDRSAFSVTTLSGQSDDRAYWDSKSAEERLAVVEQLRRLNYDYDPAERLQRVLEVAQREEC